MAGGAVWGIDIGRSSLKAVKLRKIRDELEVHALDLIEYQPSENEAEQGERQRQALASLIERNAIRRDRVYIALPGHNAFSRFIKLPPVDPKKIAEMVKYEAQQQIPFPIHDVDWDYHRVARDYEPGEEVEVGIFAIKHELVEKALGDYRELGVEPDGITIAPLAIYNYVRYDVEVDEPTVILDIGTDHTDLVVLDGPRLWIRNLPIAGMDATKALMEKFQLPFSEAEKLKRTMEKSRESKKIFSVIESTLRDLVGEIHRSIGFYKSQSKGTQVSKILLLGNGAKLFRLEEYLQSQLSYKIEKVKRINRLILEQDVNSELLTRNLPTFATAFGLAIQGVGESACAVNLIPPDVAQKKLLDRKKPLALATVGVLYLTILLVWLLERSVIAGLDETLKRTGSGATGVIGELSKAEESIKQASQLDAARGQVQDLAALARGRSLPVEVLNRMNQAFPAGNERIPVLPAGHERWTPGKRRDEVEKLARALSDKKLWLLGLTLEAAKPEAAKGEKPGEEPSAPKPAGSEGGAPAGGGAAAAPKPAGERVLVSVTIARRYIENDPSKTKDDVDRSFIAPLKKALDLDAVDEQRLADVYALDLGEVSKEKQLVQIPHLVLKLSFAYAGGTAPAKK